MEAFYGDTSLEDVDLNEGLKRIESRAFANSSATWVYMPDSLAYIAPDAFSGCADVVGYGKAGTYAESWCLTHDVPYEEETHAAEDFTYETIDGLCAKLTGYTGNATVVNVPGEIDGYRIVQITSGAFANNDSIRRVVLPDETLTLDASAFEGCDALQEAVMGANVSTINANTFNNCGNLRSVVLNEALTSIGNYAFSNTALTWIDFPDSLQSMGTGVFLNCTDLQGFGWPYGLTTSDAPFAGCSRLSHISIPSDVKRIPAGFFRGLTTLTKVTLNEGLETIGDFAFRETSLTEVALPDSLVSLGRDAFNRCGSLQAVTVSRRSRLTKIGPYAFAADGALKEAPLPSGLLEIDEGAFQDCTALTSALLPDTVTRIESYAFSGCTALSSFHYPAGLTEIGTIEKFGTGLGVHSYVFWGCKALRKIDIPEGVNGIPAYTFDGANYLREVTLPSTLEWIGGWAFRNCTAITAMEFPQGIQAVREYAFAGCTALSSAELPDSVSSIGCYAFSGCTALSSFHYPANLTEIGTTIIWGDGLLDRSFVFRNCSSLATIAVPAGVTAIPAYTFDGCADMEIVLPISVSSFGNCCFSRRENVTLVVKANSPALTYAQDNELPYRIE